MVRTKYTILLIVVLLFQFSISSSKDVAIPYSQKQNILSESSNVKSSSLLVINESQTWHGDFVINETDVVLIEDCEFTVEDGEIVVNGNLTINNSTLRIHRNTSFKYIRVYGNFTLSRSIILGRCIIYSYQDSITKIDSSKIVVIVWNHGTVYINNSDFVQGTGWGGPIIIRNSTGMALETYLSAFTHLMLANSNISSYGFYIGDNPPTPLTTLQFPSEYINRLEYSYAEWNLNITISSCYVDRWTVAISAYDPIQLTIENSTLDWLYLTPFNAPEQNYDLTLKAGFLQCKNIFVDGNLNVTVVNTTVNNWSFDVRHGTFRFTDSDFSSMCFFDSSVTIINSTMAYLATRSFSGNLTVSNVTTNALLLGIEKSMNFALTEGYQNFLNFYNEEQGFNVTVIDTTVNHWGLEIGANATVNIHNTTMTAMHGMDPSSLFTGLHIGQNSTVFVYNSSFVGARCGQSASLTFTDSTVDTLTCYNDVNVTAINSTIGTLITDPVTVTLISSRIISEILLSLQLPGDSLSASILEQSPLPLPQGIVDIGKCLHIKTSFEDTFDAQVIIYYDQVDVYQAGAREQDLKMYCLEEDSTEWQTCLVQGVNAVENYVWANVTHFSYFVIGAPIRTAVASAGGSSRKSVR